MSTASEQKYEYLQVTQGGPSPRLHFTVYNIEKIVISWKSLPHKILRYYFKLG